MREEHPLILPQRMVSVMLEAEDASSALLEEELLLEMLMLLKLVTVKCSHFCYLVDYPRH